jgi:hypothetical protein
VIAVTGLGPRETIAYVALVLGALFAAAVIALRPSPFRPSVSVDQLNAFVRLNAGGRGGTEALSTFYGWRQESWKAVAGGCGAFAVAVVLALLGAALETGKTATTTAMRGAPEVLALVGALALYALAFWLRSRALHREFSDDVIRLS